MNKLLQILWNNFSIENKIKLSMVVFLTILSSLFEIFSIGMVIPLITVLIEPSKLLQYEIIESIAFSFGINDGEDMVFPIILLFIFITIISTFVRILSIKLSANFSFLIGSELSVKAYKNILLRGYEKHKAINSSEDISKLVSKINTVIQSLIFPFVMLLGACIMFFIITLVFMVINFYLTLSVLIGLVVIAGAKLSLTGTIIFRSFLRKKMLSTFFNSFSIFDNSS